LTGEALDRWRRAERVHAFVVDLLHSGHVQCCVSLLSFEESFNAARRTVRTDTLAKRRLPNHLSDRDLRVQHPDTWSHFIQRSRSEVGKLGVRLFQADLNILVPTDQPSDPRGVPKIIVKAQELLQGYDLDVADCFHIAVAVQFGITDFAATDGAWQQVEGITVYAHRRTQEWLTP
jgi:predicted nucleic acid-binding protein